MAYSAAMTLNKSSLENGLSALLDSISTTISTKFEAPARSHVQLRASSITLSNYLGHFAKRDLRRSSTPLDPSKLQFHVFRTRGSEENTYDDVGKPIKGKKDWHRLVLSESDKKSGEVQILAEGKSMKNKENLLDAFLAAVKQSINTWVQAEKYQDKVSREKRRASSIVKGGRESEKIEMNTKKRKKGKGVLKIPSVVCRGNHKRGTMEKWWRERLGAA
jgi:hypothetical protein